MTKTTIHILLDDEAQDKINKLKRDGNYSASAVVRAALNNYFEIKNKEGKYND